MPAQVKIKLPFWYPVLRGWITRQPVAVLTSGFLALLLLIWALYGPPIGAIRKSAGQWHQLKAELEQDRRLMDTARYSQIQPLPSILTLPRILERLHTQARGFKVTILAVSPATATPAGPDGPVILPIDLQLEGEYRALGQFLGSLRNQPSLGVVTVRRVRMGREEQLLPRLRAQLSIEMALGQETDGNR